jgi:exodeoxyribonuclease V gamma subunit
MSARDVLHISYVGEGVQDGKPRNPAAPLAELLQFLDEQHTIADNEEADRPWRIRHPLQPFDARYYERDAHGQPRRDPRLFSYDPAFVATPSSTHVPSFLGETFGAPKAAASPEGEITLGALKRYWRDPAKDALLRGHGISLQALDNIGWPDREPLETGVDRIERVDRRLLFETLAAGRRELPAEPPAWLARSGMLAGGAIGAETYAELRDSLHGLLGKAQPLFADGIARSLAQAIDLDLGDGLRLTGVVDRIFHGADGGLLLFDAQPGRAAGLREMLAFYIDWAALRLTHAGTVHGDYLEPTSNNHKARSSGLLDPVRAQDAAQLRQGLRRLVEAYRSAEQQPLLFFPRTAQAYAASEPEARLGKAATAWAGDDFNGGERDYAPGYVALLSRGLELFDLDSPAHHAFVAATELVCAVLDPQHTMLLKASETFRP